VTKNLKVVQILPALDGGGVERGTLEVAEGLIQHGHQAIVISSGGRLVSSLEAMGAQHIELPIAKKSLFTLLQIRPLRKLLTQLQADVIHIRSRLPGWITYFAWKGMLAATRPKLVITTHGLHSVNAYSAIVAKGEKIIAVSETVRSYLLKNYPQISPQKIALIHRGIDPKSFPYGYQADQGWLKTWYQQYPQLAEKIVITFPGRLTRLKGHIDFIALIDGLRQLEPKIHGLIVGGHHVSKVKYYEEIKNEVQNRELQNHITFTGNRQDIKEIYSVSQLVLNLSQKPESFGRTVLEPLAMGVKVVAWDQGGVSEILAVLYPNGRVVKGDLDQLEKTVLQCLADPTKPNENNPFLLKIMLEKTFQLYQQISVREFPK